MEGYFGAGDPLIDEGRPKALSLRS